ncbi:MAG: DUF2279 domain-containing protein [Ignavibacteriaceae bacterium]|nr:DUF2279 domain-containing protein [Ignavibacteriaceae bacterium]
MILCLSGFSQDKDSLSVIPDSLKINEINLNDLKFISFKDDNILNRKSKKDIDYLFLSGMGAAYLGAGLSVHLYQANAWWSGERSDFKFAEDWDYALWIDKVGHFYATHLIAHFFSAGLEKTNIDYATNIWISSSAALAFQIFVEIEDGFAQKWGFSRGDAISNLLGASYPVFQFYFPYLYNFQPRFSYYPTKLGKEGHIAGQNLIITDDYEGQKFWLSMRIKNILPKSIADPIPDFLMLSLGYGVRNLDGRGGGFSDLYISLDIDYEKIPLYGEFWQFVKNTLGYFKFPMPGIRVNNGTTFFLLCY